MKLKDFMTLTMRHQPIRVIIGIGKKVYEGKARGMVIEVDPLDPVMKYDVIQTYTDGAYLVIIIWKGV